jgi:hypothetical protein
VRAYWHSAAILSASLNLNHREAVIDWDGARVARAAPRSALRQAPTRQRVWLNAAGDGEQWVGYSISYFHNLLTKNANWTFPQGATNNSRSFPRVTTSYTSILRTGSHTGYVLYGMGIRAFTLSFRYAALVHLALVHLALVHLPGGVRPTIRLVPNV